MHNYWKLQRGLKIWYIITNKENKLILDIFEGLIWLLITKKIIVGFEKKHFLSALHPNPINNTLVCWIVFLSKINFKTSWCLPSLLDFFTQEKRILTFAREDGYWSPQKDSNYEEIHPMVRDGPNGGGASCPPVTM